MEHVCAMELDIFVYVTQDIQELIAAKFLIHAQKIRAKMVELALLLDIPSDVHVQALLPDLHVRLKDKVKWRLN